MISQLKTFLANRKEVVLMSGLALAMLFACIGLAQAGAGGTEFDDVWTMIKNWAQGSLGRVIAGGMVIIGIAMGMARQSLMAFALGIGGGLGLFYAPTVLESILTASLPAVETATKAASLANSVGLL